jgi:phosphoribosylformylglycinamidine cyclo-ligase
MAVVVSEAAALEVMRRLETESPIEIGRVEAGQRGCTVHGRAGVWNSPEDWSATHNA